VLTRHTLTVTARELRKILKKRSELRQRGSHLVVRCGKCTAVIPVHAGEDLSPGLLRAIERQLEPCSGKVGCENEKEALHGSL
jgi:predicted RNA binding protein YcfA (HicA-like mRNA interferase family)